MKLAHTVHRFMLGCLFVGFVGCSAQVSTTPTPNATTASSTVETVSSNSLKQMSLPELQAYITDLKGKVVVLDMWATW